MLRHPAPTWVRSGRASLADSISGILIVRFSCKHGYILHVIYAACSQTCCSILGVQQAPFVVVVLDGSQAEQGFRFCNSLVASKPTQAHTCGRRRCPVAPEERRLHGTPARPPASGAGADGGGAVSPGDVIA